VIDYCSTSDLNAFGIPRGSVPNPGRVVASVNTTDNTLTLDAHDLSVDEVITFRAGNGGSLPAPLVAGTTYYADPLDDTRFRVRASVGGAAIDLTTAGSIVLLLVPLNKAAAISFASRLLDNMLPSHVVPLDADAIPDVVRHTCAELAAWKLASMRGAASKSLTDMYKAADEVVKRWAKGVPVRGTPAANKRANLAVSATAPYVDRRGWNRFGGIE
jgi:hypothetical protein